MVVMLAISLVAIIALPIVSLRHRGRPEAVVAVLTADLRVKAMGRVALGQGHNTAQLSQAVASRLAAIDVSSCPHDFIADYQQYCQSWRALARRAALDNDGGYKISDQALFDVLMSDSYREGLTPIYRSLLSDIDTKFDAVKAAAKREGEAVPKSITRIRIGDEF
jgi:hypothetical protein